MFNILAKIVKKVEIEERKREKFLRFFGVYGVAIKDCSMGAGVFDSLVGDVGAMGCSRRLRMGIMEIPPIQQKSDRPKAVAKALNQKPNY